MIDTIRKLLQLLTPRERRRGLLVLVVLIVDAVVEVAGVASILPFLTLLTTPDSVQVPGLLRWLFVTLRFTSVNEFLFFMGIAVLVLLVISNVLAAMATWVQLRFGWMRNHSLSVRLMAAYLRRPYVYFLNQNTASLEQRILMETQQVVYGVIIPGMQTVAKLVVVLFIFVLLLVVNPVLALMMILVLGSAYALIYVFVHRKLGLIGEDRVESNSERFRVVGEAFGAIKLLKLSGKESLFVQRYEGPSYRYSQNMASGALISMIPKFALETIAFGGLLLIVLYLLYTRRGLSLVLPLIGLYTFAGYRLLPALQAIFWGAAQVRFNGAALDVLRDVSSAPYNSVREVDLNGGTALPFNSVLELKGVTFYYPGTDAPVIEDLNLSIRSGSSVAFVGRTGSGKTTIADLILGLLSPSAGCIRADDVEITDENRSQWQRNLGYVPQEIYLTDDTVARNIALGIPDERIDIVAVQRAAQVAKIHDFIVNELPEGYQAKVGERGIRLSGGERQRVGIARALYQNPGVLVLDEATSALDGATEEAVFHTIESVGRARTLIIVAHRLTTVRHCDVLYVVEAGRIVARGKYDELMMSCPEFRRLARMPPS